MDLHKISWSNVIVWRNGYDFNDESTHLNMSRWTCLSNFLAHLNGWCDDRQWRWVPSLKSERMEWHILIVSTLIWAWKDELILRNIVRLVRRKEGMRYLYNKSSHLDATWHAYLLNLRHSWLNVIVQWKDIHWQWVLSVERERIGFLLKFTSDWDLVRRDKW